MAPAPHEALRLFPVFGSGLCDTELGEVIDHAVNTDNSITVLVSGDDSVVVVHFGGEVFFFCCDFSSFDQSQCDLLKVGWVALRYLGVPSAVHMALHKISELPYVAQGHTGGAILLDRTTRTLRDTGGADTTFGNSVVNAVCWFYVLLKGPGDRPFLATGEEVTQRFLELGLKAKVSRSKKIEDVSFLKGFFYRGATTGTNRFVWGPAPSRFIKMGKTAAPLSDLYPHLGPHEAAEAYLASLAATFAEYSEVPLIRAFVRRYAKEGAVALPTDLKFLVKGSGASLDDPLTFCAQHYHIDPAWFIEVEVMIRMSRPFTFLEHPLFHALALADYA